MLDVPGFPDFDSRLKGNPGSPSQFSFRVGSHFSGGLSLREIALIHRVNGHITKRIPPFAVCIELGKPVINLSADTRKFS